MNKIMYLSFLLLLCSGCANNIESPVKSSVAKNCSDSFDKSIFVNLVNKKIEFTDSGSCLILPTGSSEYAAFSLIEHDGDQVLISSDIDDSILPLQIKFLDAKLNSIRDVSYDDFKIKNPEILSGYKLSYKFTVKKNYKYMIVYLNKSYIGKTILFDNPEQYKSSIQYATGKMYQKISIPFSNTGTVRLKIDQ